MKKYFEHSLITSNIVLRQDVESDSEQIETVGAKNFPIVRIKDTTIDFGNLLSFSLSINNNFLPTISMTIFDGDYKERDSNFIEKNDIITIALGNLKDEYHNIIKNDYYVTNAENNSNGYYNINAILNVPNLYLNTNRVFVNKSSFEVIKYVAEECNLGFISNVSETNDNMNYIQHQPNSLFLEEIKKRVWCTPQSRIEIFVDQFANLNYIDVTKALNDKYTTTFVTDIEGNLLENDIDFNATNYLNDSTNYLALIQSLTPIENYGYYSRRYPKQIEVITKDLDNSNISTNILESNKVVLKDNSDFTCFKNINTYDKYEESKIKNIYTKNIYDRLKLNCNFDNYYPQIFLYQTFDVSVFNTFKVTEIDSQEEDINNDNINERVEQKQKSLNIDKNNMFSGEYMVISFDISFVYESEESNMIKQNVILLKT